MRKITKGVDEVYAPWSLQIKTEYFPEVIIFQKQDCELSTRVTEGS